MASNFRLYVKRLLDSLKTIPKTDRPKQPRHQSRLRLEPLEERITPFHNITVIAGGTATLAQVANFSFMPNVDATIDPATIDAAGANVALQANNDIIFTNAVSMANPGVQLSAQAGRSILANSNITTIDAALTFTANETVANGVVDANRDAGTAVITLAGGSALNTGAGPISMTISSGPTTNNTSGGITLGAGSSLTTTDGGITLTALQGPTTATGNFIGIDVNGAAITTSGAGNILLQGRGGNDAATGSHFGVNVHNGATVSSTGTGTITLTGTGGTGTSGNVGVRLIDAGTLVTSATGAITITGQGGNGTADFNQGISMFSGAHVSSTGTGATAATITLNGTGGTGTDATDGVELSDSGTLVTTADGNIAITGQGGTGSTNFSEGVLLNTGVQLTSTGTGTITIDGTGGTGTTNNYGVDIFGSGTLVSSATGNINITGTGGNGSGVFNPGIIIHGSGQVTSTGTGASAAKITITGTGGGAAGSDQNDGFQIDNTSTVSSVDGAIQVSGTAGTGPTSQGINIQGTSQVTATGTAPITFNGGTAPDTYGVKPVTGTITINGNSPANDTLNIDLTGTTNPTLTPTGPNSGQYTFGNRGTVTYSGIQTLNQTGGTTALVVSAAALGLQDGNAATDTLELQLDATGTQLQILDGNDGAAPSLVASYPVASISSVSVVGSSDPDQLILNFANGNPIIGGNLSYDGGLGSNSLLLEGGTFTTETYSATGPGAGTINLDGSVITYSNLRPITDTNTATNLIFNTPVTATPQQVNIVDGSMVNGAQTAQINSGSSGTFESLDFANKTNVTVNDLGTGSDTLSLNNPTLATGLTTLTLNTGSGNDTTTVQATPAGLTTLNVVTGAGSDTVTVQATSVGLTTTVTKVMAPSMGAMDSVFIGNNPTAPNDGTVVGVQGIRGIVQIQNPTNGLTNLTVDDTGDLVSQPAVIISSGSITGLAPAAINYSQDALNQLTVNGDSLGNGFTITSTPSNATVAVATVLNSGGGTDTVGVQSTSGTNGASLLIQGQGGADSVTLGGVAGVGAQNLLGPITVTNAGGVGNSTSLLVDDSQDMTGRNITANGTTITGIAPALITIDASVSNVTLNGGSGADTFAITPSAGTQFTVNGNNPTTPPGDVLTVDLMGTTGATLTPTGQGSGEFTFSSGQMPVIFTGIETLQTANGRFDLDICLAQLGFQDGNSNPDLTTAQLDPTGTTLMIQIFNNFSGQVTPDYTLNVAAASVNSLTVMGSSDPDFFQLIETAGGLPSFPGMAPATACGLTSGAHSDVPSGGVLNPTTAGINFNGGAGSNSMEIDFSTAHNVNYYSDTAAAGNSGNVLVQELSLVSFENLRPVTMLGNGGTLTVDATPNPSVTALNIASTTGMLAGTGFNTVSDPNAAELFESVTFDGFDTLDVLGGTGSQTITLQNVDSRDPGNGHPLTGVSLTGDNTTGTDNAANTINVEGIPVAGVTTGIPVNVNVTVVGTAGADTINVGSTPTTPATSLLDGILGTVTIHGKTTVPAVATTTLSLTACAGTTSAVTASTTVPVPNAQAGTVVNIDDAGSAANNTYVLDRTDATHGTFQRTAVMATGVVTFDTVSTVNVAGGTGNNTVNVNNTVDAINTFVNNANGGADSVTVTTTGTNSNTGITAGAGSDTIIVNGTGLTSQTQISGGPSADNITINNTGMGSGLVVNGGGGADTITEVSTGANSATQFNGGAQNVVFNIQGTGGGSATDVNAGASNDTINIGGPGNTLGSLGGAVCVHGTPPGPGPAPTQTEQVITLAPCAQTVTNTVPIGTLINANDQGSTGQTYTLTPTELTASSAPAPIFLSNVNTLDLNAASGDNTININGTGNSTNTNINNANAGNDSITVGSTGTSSNLVIDAGAGNNTIGVTTTGNMSVTIITAQAGADSVTVSGTGTSSGLQVNGGGGADTITLAGSGATSAVQLNALAASMVGVLFNIRATGMGSNTEANGDAGNDTFNVGSTTNVVDGILGAVCVHGNGNTAAPLTTLNVTTAAPCAATVTNGQPVGDILNLNDQASALNNTYALTASTFQRTAVMATGVVNFDTVETINFNAGTGNNTINVAGTANQTNTTINNANGGSDTIAVTTTGMNSNLVINAGTGANVITVTTTGSGSITQINAQTGADSITVSMTGSGSGMQVNGGGGADTITLGGTGMNAVTQLNALPASTVGVLFNIEATGTGSNTEVNGSRGTDTFNVGSTTNVLDGIQGAICVHGMGSTSPATTSVTVTTTAPCAAIYIGTLPVGDILNFNDQGSMANNTYSMNSEGGTSSFMRSAALATGRVEWDKVGTVNLNAGTGNNTINVANTDTFTTTSINNANGGSDTITATTFNLQTILIINAGTGANVINASNLGGDGILQINGQMGADSITVEALGGNMGVQVNGGGGADTITLASSSPGAVAQLNALATGVGVLFNVEESDFAMFPPDGAVTEVNGGAGNDTLNVGSIPGNQLDNIQAPVCFHGNGGTNTLNVNDQGSNSTNTYTVTGSTVQRVSPSTALINYDNVQFLNLNAGNSTDTVNVQSTSAVTTVTTGPQNDVINVSSNAPANSGTLLGILGNLIVNGDGGSNTLNISDSGDLTGRTGTLTNSTVTGLGMTGTITYSNLATLNLQLSQGNDLLMIDSTHAGTTTNVFGTAGNDTICVMQTSSTTNLTTGPGNSDFAFADGANLSGGKLTGGTSGINTLNLAAYTSSVRVNLSTSSAPIKLDSTQVVIAGLNNNMLNPGDPTSMTFTATGDTDTVLNIQNVLSGSGNDTLIGGNFGQNEQLESIAGNNFIVGGTGPNTLIGGSGNDVIQGGASHNSNLIVGNGGNNTLIGGNGPNVIVGGIGSNLLIAGPSNDLLFGGVSPSDTANFNKPRLSTKRDTLLGGAGVDIFLITNCNDLLNGSDILQFGTGGGRIDLITSNGFTAETSFQTLNTATRMMECSSGPKQATSGVISAAALAKNRLAVASGILNSTENRADLITGYYQQFLGRNADAGGLQHWLNVVGASGRQEDVIAGIVGSDEYYARQGGTDAGFVSCLYHDLLGRGAGQSEIAYWSGKLASVGRSGVAAAILASDEYRGGLIDSYYERYYARHVDASGLQTLLTFMAQGGRDEDVQAQILASDEYLQRISAQFFDVNRGFVIGLYRDVLHRSAAQSEIDSWLGQLSAVS